MAKDEYKMPEFEGLSILGEGSYGTVYEVRCVAHCPASSFDDQGHPKRYALKHLSFHPNQTAAISMAEREFKVNYHE